MLVSSASQAKGAIMWQIRRRIGTAIDKASVNLLIDRVALMAQARGLRERSRARVFNGTPCAVAHEHRLQQLAHSTGWTGRIDH